MNKTPQDWQQINAVLVVDDDDNWCYISKRVLQKAGVGKQVITAQNGLAAIKKLQTMAAHGEQLPELIFIDIKMPVMDGFEFMDEIPKRPELDLSQTRIFICSSSFHSGDMERAKLYPIAGFISKPLTEQLLKDILT